MIKKIFMYQYQRDGFFAQAPGKMEELCKQELLELGATNTKIAYRGVYFKADKPALYKINYTSRLLSRVLAPLITFHCHNTNVLIKTAEKIRWEEIFSVDKTFAITGSVAKSQITNSLYTSSTRFMPYFFSRRFTIKWPLAISWK